MDNMKVFQSKKSKFDAYRLGESTVGLPSEISDNVKKTCMDQLSNCCQKLKFK